MINTQISKHVNREMVGLEVTQASSELFISGGTYRDFDTTHALPEISFLIEGEADNEILHDLYIVEANGEYTYHLEKVYMSYDTLAFYNGPDKLIHSFVNVQIINNEEPIITVHRIISDTKIRKVFTDDVNPKS